MEKDRINLTETLEKTALLSSLSRTEIQSLAARTVRKHFASGERFAWSANRLVKGTAMVGVWGPIPPGRMAAQIHIGDGPYLHGHTRVE